LYVYTLNFISVLTSFPLHMDESDALFQRKIILRFPNEFEGNRDDPDLLKKLTTEEEVSGVFNIMMIALRGLSPPGRTSMISSVLSLLSK